VITTPLDEATPAVSAGALRRPAGRTLRLRDGRVVRVRPIRPSDAELLREFDGGLCEANHRFRYLGWMPPLPADRALAMATVDFEHRFALVATARREGREVIVADCRMVAEPDGTAEIAIAVADDHHDVGLGPTLIRLMLAIAAIHGIETVVAQVRFDNAHMMHVLRGLGFERTAWELGVVTFVARPCRVPMSERRSALRRGAETPYLELGPSGGHGAGSPGADWGRV
jgi:RimJ/RimL family protein N-acetyltransferase